MRRKEVYDENITYKTEYSPKSVEQKQAQIRQFAINYYHLKYTEL